MKRPDFTWRGVYLYADMVRNGSETENVPFI